MLNRAKETLSTLITFSLQATLTAAVAASTSSLRS
jgi:hypothetical protein